MESAEARPSVVRGLGMKQTRVQSPLSKWQRGFLFFITRLMRIMREIYQNMTKARVKILSLFLALACLFLLPEMAEANQPRRIISLAPNMTEMLFALGLGNRVVGVTTFCDRPAEAMEKPKVGGMSTPSLEAVVSLRPDIVMITTDGNPAGVDMRLRDLGLDVYISRARSIHELPEEVLRIGRLLGATGQAEALSGRIERTIDKYRVPEAGGSGEKVAFIIWPEPLMLAGDGTAVDDVIRLLGYRNLAGGTGINYPRFSLEELITRAPDHVFIGVGEGMINSEEDVRKLSARLVSRLKHTPAFKRGRIHFVSDSLYRLGPRVVDGIEELRGLLEREDR
jgi:iron complex transport system substrate-binding protein